MMIAQQFIKEGHPVKLVLEVLEIPRSSYYYRPKPGTGCKGREQSTHRIQRDGSIVSNEVVVKDIEWILGQEFVDYGYLKVTHWLRQERDYDNGSQFIAHKVQRYFENKGVVQEFCKPATPEQNAHIESYHSIQERVICQRYEFDFFTELAQTLNRIVDFYNFRRIHSGTKHLPPYKFILQKGIDMRSFDLTRALDCCSLKSNILVE